MLAAFFVQYSFVFVVGILSYVFYKIYRHRKIMSWMPTAKGVPILGSALAFKDSADYLPVLMQYTRTNGNLFTMNVFHRTFIVASDPKFLEFLLTSRVVLDKGSDYKFLDNWLGTGLLTSGAEKWKKSRKIITPAFHFSILEKFVDVFESNGDILMKKLEKEVDGDSFDVRPYITLFALDTICETALGVSINAQDNKNEDYVFAVKEMCRITVDRAFSPIKMYDLFYFLSKDYYKEKRYVNTLHKYTISIINEKMEELRNKSKLKNKPASEESKDDENRYNKKIAFLDLLLQMEDDGEPLPFEYIRQEVDTFMFEGHDTVSSATSFALYCLANNPDVQEKAYQEQKHIFSNKNNDTVSFSDLVDMKYLDSVIKESLRLYPSVPLYSRETMQEVHYEGKIIPEHTTILVFAYGAGRNPEFFPDPEKFDPSRFDGTQGRPPFSYLPFSAGPRNCIGQKYAMAEMKSVISKILRSYEILPAGTGKVILIAETVLNSKNGIRIKIKKRNSQL